MNRALARWRYITDSERPEVWCEEHVMSVYEDEWEEHVDEYHC